MIYITTNVIKIIELIIKNNQITTKTSLKTLKAIKSLKKHYQNLFKNIKNNEIAKKSCH